MIHNITKDEYIKNPCGVCSVAYWKNLELEMPNNIQVIHELTYTASENKPAKYFRLLHRLDNISYINNDDYIIKTVNISTQKHIVADILEKCYDAKYPIETIDKWTSLRVFDNDLWIFVMQRNSHKPIALGIADYDSNIKEGSLEWIQVLPEYRKLGIGKLIVNELLARLKSKAEFVTVSGECDNETNPELLYRKCGFFGNDIWYVIQT